MLLVAIGWLYVVGMYSATQASLGVGLVIFVVAGAVPAAVMVWFSLRRMRMQRSAYMAEEKDRIAEADTERPEGRDRR